MQVPSLLHQRCCATSEWQQQIWASTLDSDGNYNDDNALGSNAAFTNVSNGAWHMVTLTTRTDVQHGYLLYIDGQEAGVSHA